MDYTSRAPGRVCLFGDHQDYLQLPIIACAIDRYIKLRASPNTSKIFNISKLDLGEQYEIPLDVSDLEIDSGDFLGLALRVLRRYGCVPDRGFDVAISGNIPINAGLSSSSALTVAWIQFLTEAFGIDRKMTPALMAQLAYETEVTERGSSGGKMDQYTIALGSLIYLDTKDNQVETFDTPIAGLVVGVSGVAKDTFESLAKLKKGAWDAIDQVQQRFPGFQIAKARPEDIFLYEMQVEEELWPIFAAAVLNHAITQQARVALKKEVVDLKEIGELMNQHHALLRDNLKVTVPRIDAMTYNALEAGAYGTKIVGSGGGGCIVALAPEDKKQAVAKAIRDAGAVDAFAVKQSGGAMLDMRF